MKLLYKIPLNNYDVLTICDTFIQASWYIQELSFVDSIVNTRDSKAIDNHSRCKNNGSTSLPFTCKTDLLIDFILLNGSSFFKLEIMNGLFLLSCLSSSLQFECFISLDCYFLRRAMILNLDCNSLQLLSLLISMFLDGYFEDCNLLLVACLNR